jgi:hypothetical protein
MSEYSLADVSKVVDDIVKSQGGNPDEWSKEYQGFKDKLYEIFSEYSKHRFAIAYDLGFAHGKGKTLEQYKSEQMLKAIKV